MSERNVPEMEMKNSILGLPSDKVEDLLEKLHILKNIQNGEIKCIICDNNLTIENIGIIYPNKNEIILSCDMLLCVQKMTELFAPLRRVTGDSYEEE